MTSCPPGIIRSRTGIHATEIPEVTKSWAIRRLFRRMASTAKSGWFTNFSTRAPADGVVGQLGGCKRATRPPSWSIKMGRRGRFKTSRSWLVKLRSCCGSEIFRLNKMNPYGLTEEKKITSSADSTVPEQPKIMGEQGISGGHNHTLNARSQHYLTKVFCLLPVPHYLSSQTIKYSYLP